MQMGMVRVVWEGMLALCYFCGDDHWKHPVCTERPLWFQHLSFILCISLMYRVPISTTFHSHVHLYVCGTEIWLVKFCVLWVHHLAAITSAAAGVFETGFIWGGSFLHAGRFQIHPPLEPDFCAECRSDVTEEFSPRKFWWNCNNILNISNSDSDDSLCILLTDEQMSHRCVLQLLQNSPTAEPDIS